MHQAERETDTSSHFPFPIPWKKKNVWRHCRRHAFPTAVHVNGISCFIYTDSLQGKRDSFSLTVGINLPEKYVFLVLVYQAWSLNYCCSMNLSTVLRPRHNSCFPVRLWTCLWLNLKFWSKSYWYDCNIFGTPLSRLLLLLFYTLHNNHGRVCPL